MGGIEEKAVPYLTESHVWERLSPKRLGLKWVSANDWWNLVNANARIAVTKQCSHVMSCFTIPLFRDGNSRANCDKSKTTCTSSDGDIHLFVM